MNKDEILRKIKNNSYKIVEKPRAKSEVWKLFALIETEDGTVIPNVAYCRNCWCIMKTHNKQTSNLTRHGCYLKMESKTIPIQKLNPEEKIDFLEICVQWVVRDCVPFSVVDGSGFQSVIESALRIGTRNAVRIDVLELIPDSSTISRRVIAMAEEEKIQIQSQLQKLVEDQRVVIAADIWTDSFVRRSFLGVTFHYYDDKFHEIILGLKSMDLNEISGELIHKKMENLLLEFNITDWSKLIFITDFRSDMINAFNEQTRINCSNHIFSNILESAFKSSEELHPFIENCKKLVKFLKKSKFQHILDTTLKSQCTTYWYSHFQMFLSIYENWQKINEILAEIDELDRISDIRFDLLKPIVDLCDKFNKISKKLQSFQTVSISFVYPSINRLRAICSQKVESTEITIFKMNIIENIELLWVPNLSVYHKAAVFFYPPTNNFLNEDDFIEVKLFCVQAENECESIQPQAKKIKLNTQTAELDDSLFFFPEIIIKDQEMCTDVNESVIEMEINAYKRQKILLDIEFDAIAWWKIHSNEFSRLSKLAIRVLSIPASSAAVTRAFSLAGNILMEKRNRLESKTFDSVLFLNSIFADDN